jgi:hypothetical protein
LAGEITATLKRSFMKKILLVLLFMYGVTVLRAQIPDTTQPKIPLQFDPDLLFQKAGKQKTTAWMLPGAGAGLTIAGYIVDANAIENDPCDLFGVTSSAAQTGAVMLLAGAAAMVASVPFFILSGKKRRKAILVLKNESGSLSRLLHYKENFSSFGINIKI